MIHSLIHPGSGLGNQLHRIVAGKVLALDRGYEYSAIGRENFKGKSFMNIDFGPENDIPFDVLQPAGKILPKITVNEKHIWEEKTPYYNPEFNFVENDTIIDGEFQSIQYFGHRLNEIIEWLAVEPVDVPHDTCIIGFRGGEFYAFPELGLPLSYYEGGIKKMKEGNPDMKFEVHTDDVGLAKQFFPDFPAVHDIGINWRSIRSAKHAIIANSSFYILPRLLKHHESHGAITIAPRYWARYNTKEWSRPDNYYRRFTYI